MDDVISSTANPAIKRLQSLIKNNRKRREEGVVIIEGVKEISAALHSGYTFTEIFVCREIFKDSVLEMALLKASAQNPLFIREINTHVYESLAYRESRQGIIALAWPGSHLLSDLKLRKNPLILVLEAVEKPGNLGAMLRTADAAGADAVVVCDPLADIYNPNVIRSSVGCVFYCPIAVASSADTINWLKEHHIKVYATALPATKMYYDINFCGPTALVMGSEAEGLSRLWFDHADELIKIPMLGKTDSLNVSTSAAIVVYEAVRQREFL